jgi:hypothetical protein
VDRETVPKRSAEQLGKEIVFKQKKERNFISADVKIQVMSRRFAKGRRNGKKIYGQDDFAAKYILKVFADQQRSRQC